MGKAYFLSCSLLTKAFNLYSKFTVKVSIESTSEKETAEACKKLLEMIPAEVIIGADDRS